MDRSSRSAKRSQLSIMLSVSCFLFSVPCHRLMFPDSRFLFTVHHVLFTVAQLWIRTTTQPHLSFQAPKPPNRITLRLLPVIFHHLLAQDLPCSSCSSSIVALPTLEGNSICRRPIEVCSYCHPSLYIRAVPGFFLQVNIAVLRCVSFPCDPARPKWWHTMNRSSVVPEF
jgi:hypothetical protein